MAGWYYDEPVLAEEHLQSALKFGVRTSHDRCLLTLTLVDLAMKQKDFTKAEELLETARSIPHKVDAEEEFSKFQRDLERQKGQASGPTASSETRG